MKILLHLKLHWKIMNLQCNNAQLLEENCKHLASRESLKADEDAECVRLMKNSEAIIIATSNIPEINMWCETRNNRIGQTNNPYDLRSAGDSSGGEAALISAWAQNTNTSI
uniref:Amidase domain-containing protein n=1 Tax=Glossina palpalis gambiensis TaxID=67801 RepID=A0A1B0BLF8_9MUSC